MKLALVFSGVVCGLAACSAEQRVEHQFLRKLRSKFFAGRTKTLKPDEEPSGDDELADEGDFAGDVEPSDGVGSGKKGNVFQKLWRKIKKGRSSNPEVEDTEAEEDLADDADVIEKHHDTEAEEDLADDADVIEKHHEAESAESYEEGENAEPAWETNTEPTEPIINMPPIKMRPIKMQSVVTPVPASLGRSCNKKENILRINESQKVRQKLENLATTVRALQQRTADLGYGRGMKTVELNSVEGVNRALTEMEAIFNMPRFRSRSLDVNEEHEHEAEEGEDDADKFAASEGNEDEKGVGGAKLKQYVKSTTDDVENLANKLLSYTTGIDDYLGVEQQRQKLKAKALANLGLSMGLSEDDAANISGESLKQVAKDEEKAKTNSTFF